MNEPSMSQYLVVVAICLLLAMAGLYMLANFGRLFKGTIRNELLRKNVAVWITLLFLSSAVAPMSGGIFVLVHKYGWPCAIGAHLLGTTITTLFIFNVTRWVALSQRVKRASFPVRMLVIVSVLVASMIAVNLPLSYYFYDKQSAYLTFSIVSSVYMGAAIGLVYAVVNYLDIERQRKFDEKELELSRLRELKAKAELDALHSKVNPHFLYNALNSIADLSITDGKKARKMTIALADLFRYSINYSQNNFSTVNDEVAMTEVYLQIERIRFEDQLSYSVLVGEGAGHYLLPRFLLQPLVENAVKHGLKATGKMTGISLEINLQDDRLVINLVDNGPPFPDEILPGYGVKSVFDKLDLLFPDQYEMYFRNEPRKEVTIYLKKLIKNESAL